ncbi:MULTISPECIES: excinuclease ABC subunit UvrC [Alistipes]|uniref:UvrABC system protein C n=2 Tax=Alistipes TaxID=239759 RepID=A0ABY5VAD3_9BACT|nr:MULTISPECIES: excinuclease ABC subunit UvrC [Alistipes]MBQ7893453.1 excinuclease ABC subunit C [Alistipes sp.]MBR2217091.1 excinuclease ABC subunit C [Alistipes sp.]MBS5525372.1 excinuclease ABC subunit UvrC [Alistipes sp.]MCI7309095.1 excinuclease ABC subunit UvrC [Alistipes senegalensis]MDD7039674.1 excinuclease ABC subunit UvrC [Alistipes senegalensis]
MGGTENNSLREQVALLPLSPGVYQFLDRSGTIIYVGKAKSLRKRVSSYFVQSKEHSPKVRVLVKQIAAIRHIVVGSETDALLLENSLIKTLQPRYNILLKDDKTYPWIVVRREHFPRVQSTRTLTRDGSQYFGPYGSVMMQHSVLDFIREVVPLRTCKLNLDPGAIARGKYTVCLQYHLGNCKGPCVGRQSEEEYGRLLEMVVSVLKGDLRPVRQYLEGEMARAAAELKFELAQRYKQRLDALDNYAGKSVIVSAKIVDVDVFSLLPDDDVAWCNFVRIRHGSIVGVSTVKLSTGVGGDERDMLTLAIQHIVEHIAGGGLAREVIVPFLPSTTLLFDGVTFTVPKRGEKLELLEFSQKSARIYRAEQLKNLEIKNPERYADRLMNAMQKELRLDRQPRHIECFDNSNLQGSHPVASCVVFRDGKPSRKEYRHFNIKTVEGPDDYASMREVVFRRYTRLMAEGAELPDLIIADGGKGQMGVIHEVLERLGLDIPIAGLAKDDRHRTAELLCGFPPLLVGIRPTSPLFHFLSQIQEEVHRFAIAFHRQKRSKAFIHSELEQIEGIGDKTVQTLLRHFRTVEKVRAANIEELSALVGPAKAKKIKAFFEK